MKKIYNTLLLSLSLLYGCEKIQDKQGHISDVQRPVRSYIFFAPEVIDVAQTKTHIVEGTQLPITANTAFGVLGTYNSTWLFGNYDDNIAKVYRKEDGASFDYDNISPWPDGTADYSFYAFYPFSINNKIDITADNIPCIGYTQPSDVSDMVDILTATKTTKRTELVKLDFTHRLWALDIKVKNSQENDVPYFPDGTDETLPPTLSVSSAKVYVKGFYKSGNISITSGLSSPQIADEIAEYNIVTNDVKVAKGETIALEPLLFLPVNKTLAYRLEFEFKNAWGAKYDFYYPAQTTDESGNPIYSFITLSNMDFQAGYRYSLTIEKKETSGAFTINWDVMPWSAVNVDHTFN